MSKRLSVLLLSVCVLLVGAAGASASEDFFWKNSYGRGVGKIPAGVCGAGQEDDGALCYQVCKEGYHGVGPVCWSNDQMSYGRGAGTIPHWFERCDSGQDKDAGLCYNSCKAGYHGVGPVCWNNEAQSYGRGVGIVPNYVCPGGQDKDAGLCYPKCQSGYEGIGPVCWGVAPTGYVDCGAGFATTSVECAEIIAPQTTSVVSLTANTIPAAMAARKAAMGPQEIKQAEQVAEALSPFIQSVKSIVAKGSGAVSEVSASWKSFKAAHNIDELSNILKVVKVGKNNVTGAEWLAQNPKYSTIDELRIIANIAAPVDPTGVLSVVAAYMYPTYEP